MLNCPRLWLHFHPLTCYVRISGLISIPFVCFFITLCLVWCRAVWHFVPCLVRSVSVCVIYSVHLLCHICCPVSGPFCIRVPCTLPVSHVTSAVPCLVCPVSLCDAPRQSPMATSHVLCRVWSHLCLGAAICCSSGLGPSAGFISRRHCIDFGIN